MSIARLTERKLRDARFRKNEEALFRAFFEEEVEMKLSMGELARKIGVNRVTIYRHHRMPREIMGDYERHILEKYVELMVEIRKREGMELRRMYYEVILFILQNRRIFEMLMERKNFKVLEGMIVMLEPEIMDFIKLSGDVLKNSESLKKKLMTELAPIREKAKRNASLAIELLNR